MENYTVEQFLKDVRAEACAIRKHAMPGEIARLSFNNLDPEDQKLCIYGQMTGNCFSQRAAEIIFACCPRYFNSENFRRFTPRTSDYAIKAANGSKIDGVNDSFGLYIDRDKWSSFHFSAVEMYIMMDGAKNAELIAYLKGETDTLEL
jgi:hypothetical protein